MFVTYRKKSLIIKWPCLAAKKWKNSSLAKKKSFIGLARGSIWSNKTSSSSAKILILLHLTSVHYHIEIKFNKAILIKPQIVTLQNVLSPLANCTAKLAASFSTLTIEILSQKKVLRANFFLLFYVRKSFRKINNSLWTVFKRGGMTL